MAGLAFSGNANHIIDAKGRATIPSQFRGALGEGFTLGLSNDLRALALYPKEQWQRTMEELERFSRLDEDGMDYVRFVMGFSLPETNLDAQGRVLLPPTFRQEVGIEKSVRFVGVGTCLEIWPEELFVELTQKVKGNREKLLKYIRNQYYGQSTQMSDDPQKPLVDGSIRP